MTEKKTTLELLQAAIYADYGPNTTGLDLNHFAIKFLCAQVDELKTELKDLKHKIKMNSPYRIGPL